MGSDKYVLQYWGNIAILRGDILQARQLARDNVELAQRAGGVDFTLLLPCMSALEYCNCVDIFIGLSLWSMRR